MSDEMKDPTTNSAQMRHALLCVFIVIMCLPIAGAGLVLCLSIIGIPLGVPLLFIGGLPLFFIQKARIKKLQTWNNRERPLESEVPPWEQ